MTSLTVATAALRAGFDTAPAALALHDAGAEPEIEHNEGLTVRTVAIFGPARTYRYLLFTRWDDGPVLTVTGLNPSTATAHHTDATWTRVTRRAQNLVWAGRRFGAVAMTNLFALVATNPGELNGHPDPAGPGNDACLREFCGPQDTVIAAWGSHEFARERAAAVTSMFAASGADLLCLGTNQDGSPRHPGRLAYSVPVQPWRPA